MEASIFPTPSEVMNEGDPVDNYWAVTELGNVYHQIRIPTHDVHLVGILLEDGLYHYCRQPMGFVNSGHRFANIVSHLLADLNLNMEVDDVIVGGHTVEEVTAKFKEFLLHCRKHNIKHATSKLQFAMTVEFA